MIDVRQVLLRYIVHEASDHLRAVHVGDKHVIRGLKLMWLGEVVVLHVLDEGVHLGLDAVVERVVFTWHLVPVRFVHALEHRLQDLNVTIVSKLDAVFLIAILVARDVRHGPEGDEGADASEDSTYGGR